MIVFDLNCSSGHRFEGWFGSSEEFGRQQESGLVECPRCGSQEVQKAPMAPSLPRKANQKQSSEKLPVPAGRDGADSAQAVTHGPLPAEVVKALKGLAAAQARALRDSKWVGTEFSDRSRAMHYGERETESIHGQASLEDAQALLDEGITIAPLPFPVAPPEDLN